MKRILLLVLLSSACATAPQKQVALMAKGCNDVHRHFQENVQMKAIDCRIEAAGEVPQMTLSFPDQATYQTEAFTAANLIQTWCSTTRKTTGKWARYSWEFRQEKFQRVAQCDTPEHKKLER